ncbi:MAG: hypothetical protein LAQ69_18505 [Acidobacteriia bacterium]|nr:hypothetical protein [Terriglobia bacterium]
MIRAVVTGLLCGWCAASAPSLHVNPAASSISLRGPTTVSLAIQNDAGEPTASSIRLEWLDPKDTIRGSAVENVRIAPGKSTIVLACPFPMHAGPQALWYRLRYRIHTEAGEAGGMLTVAHASRDAFELRVASPPAAVPGEKYRITAVAVTVVEQRPLEGVRITGRVGSLSASAVTDTNGAATLEIAVPCGVLGSWNAQIEGRLGDFNQSVSTTATIEWRCGDSDRHR